MRQGPDNKGKTSVKDQAKAFEHKSNTVSSASSKAPTASTDTDEFLASRVDENAVRKTAEVFGAQQKRFGRDPHQDTIRSEENNAKDLGISIDEYRAQVREQRRLENEKRSAAKSEEEKANELGMSVEEYRQQIEAMNKFKKK